MLLDLVSMRQIILLHLVCDNMSHRPAGGTISSGTTYCAPFGGNDTISSGATKCRADLRSAVGGTTSCGLAPLGILHVARPFGALRGVVSM